METARGNDTPGARRITTCNKGFARKNARYVSFPELRLKGKWLLQSGFRSGHVVDVACKEGRLIITLAREQRFSNI